MSQTISWQESPVKKRLEAHLPSEIPIYPMRRYVSVVILREFTRRPYCYDRRADPGCGDGAKRQWKYSEPISRVLLQSASNIRTGAADRPGLQPGSGSRGKMCFLERYVRSVP